MTPAGRRQLRKLDRLVARAQDELLSPLSPEGRHDLINLLTRLLEHHSTP